MVSKRDEIKKYLFETWAKAFDVPISDDYDMQGYFENEVLKGKSNQDVSAYDNQMHFTDEYKLPNHETFSKQSKYWKEGMPNRDWAGNYFMDMETGQILKDETPTPQGVDPRFYNIFRRGR